MVCCDLLKYFGIWSLTATSLLLTDRQTCHTHGLVIADTYTHSIIQSHGHVVTHIAIRQSAT